jgi:CheY-like chemotaxis protein
MFSDRSWGGSERDVVTADAAHGVDLDTIADLQQRIDVLSAFAGGILCELDRDGRFLGIWTGEEHLLLRPVNEMIGLTISDTIGPASGARFHAMVRDVIDAGAPSDFEHTLDVRAGRRTFSCAMRPLDPRGGGQRRVTLMLRDITAAKQLERKLVRTERLAALGLFAARRPRDPAAARVPHHEPRRPRSPARQGREGLVIDDEPRFLESLRLALEDIHLVETRPKAADALELLRADPRRFDVVLCDLAMPGMDGVTFYDRMLEMGVGDRFILMTGGAFTARASDFMRSEACPTISKPFPLERLLALLDDVTQARRAS